MNGRPIPIQSVSLLPASDYPRNVIVAQFPYDVEGSTATLEIEDKTGSKRTFPVSVKPVLPVSRDSFQFVPATRRAGQEMVLRMTGLGATVSPAPLGAVPSASIVPQVPIQAFVGGRRSRLISVELSRTEVGTFEVRFEVPPIAPDLHVLSLSVGNMSLSVGYLTVTQ